MKVNERRTVVGGLIGHCVSPQPWREIDAHEVLHDPLNIKQLNTRWPVINIVMFIYGINSTVQ